MNRFPTVSSCLLWWAKRASVMAPDSSADSIGMMSFSQHSHGWMKTSACRGLAHRRAGRSGPQWNVRGYCSPSAFGSTSSMNAQPP